MGGKGMRKFLLLGVCALATTQAFAFPARFGLGPDNNQELYLSTLKSAQHQLLLNIYELKSQEITRAIIDRIHEGITVQVLLEGQPFGMISDEGLKQIYAIRDAMVASGNSRDKFFVMTNAVSKADRRFRYDHAKYVVVDSTVVNVSSENLTPTGHTNAGKFGNRGWEVILEDSDVAAQIADVFREDTRLDSDDIFVLGPNDKLPRSKKEGDDQETLWGIDTSWFVFGAKSPKDPNGLEDQTEIDRPVPTLPMSGGNVRTAKVITSPESLDDLVSLIRSAKEHLELEWMSLPSTWRDSISGKRQNPVVTELIAAAKRGVQVRVLLNDEHVWDDPKAPKKTPAEKTANEETVALLKKTAKKDGIPLEARIVNVDAAGITYIHNKGILVDGKKALVSSINGTQNSMDNNRELAVLLSSDDAAKYYGEAFDLDWQRSAKKKKSP